MEAAPNGTGIARYFSRHMTARNRAPFRETVSYTRESVRIDCARVRRPLSRALRAVCIAAAVTVSLGAVACTTTGGTTEPRDGDAELFATEVQSIVRRRCSFLGCHGREGVPLTTYAVDYLRMRDPDGDIDPSKPALDERALAPAELDHNRRAVAARIGPDDPDGDRRRFLNRLISEEQGGIPHADVVVYERADDPELDLLRRFLETVK